MSARGVMVHRAVVTRRLPTTGADDFGRPILKDRDEQIACWIWADPERLEWTGEMRAGYGDYRGLLPYRTPIAIGDRIGSVQDRRGSDVYPTREFTVTSVYDRPTHREVSLRTVHG